MNVLPMITAHTGNDGTPNNSIESVRKSIALGADALEVDVRKDHNKILTLSHNVQTQNIYDTSPRLNEVMEIISHYPDIRINCDLKDADLPLETIHLAKSFGIEADRLILTGMVTPSFLARHPEIVEHASIYINAECILEEIYLKEAKHFLTETQITEYYDNPWRFWKKTISSIDSNVESLTKVCRQYGVKGLNIPYAVLTDKSLAHFKKTNIPLSVWTVDKKEEMMRFFSYGVANLTTRCVQVAKSVRKDLFGF